MRTWVQNVWRLVRRPARRRPSRSYRPAVEGLDERCLPAHGGFFQQVNLASDQPGHAAILDPNLVNAWGIAVGPITLWVSENGTGFSGVYNGGANGQPFVKNSLLVTIPGGSPTGQVFNPTGDFVVSDGTHSGPALFIFASETGQITGWNPGVPPPPPSTMAQNGVTVPGAVFKGIALGSANDQNFLYAADFHSGHVLVFNSHFQPVTLSGSFTDPRIPRHFAPFNIENINGLLYVTYARQKPDRHDDQAGPGNGFVDVFDTSGNFLRRLASRGHLNSPWGLALAPSNFGKFSGALLVGNFGDGHINAFNPVTGHFLGQLNNRHHHPLTIDGLWGLAFGNGTTVGNTNELFFVAGPKHESHGLLGDITAVP